MRLFLLAGSAFVALVPAVAYADDTPPATTSADSGGAPSDPAPAPIIVTASPLGHRADDTPAIAARVNAEAILRAGGASIANALADVPGIASSGFAAGASRPIIRGMDASRVRMLENGTSGSDVSDIGPDHGVPIDPLAARSLEIVRGAGTLRYGSQAIGGVVNVLNNRVPDHLGTTPVTGELNGSYDTVSDTWQGSALTDVTLGNFALHADGFYRNADDYDTPLGRQANSFFRGNGESLGGSYFIGGGESHIGAAVIRYDANYGLPSDDTYIDMKQTKVLTRSSFALGGGLFKTFTLDGSYADYQHSEREPDGTIDTTFRNKEWDAHGELQLGNAGPLDGTALGFEYQHRAFSAVGEDSSYLYPATSENIAGYLFTDMRLGDRFHVEASGRIEHVSIDGTPASNVPTEVSFTPVSGALGALYDAGGGVKFGLTLSSTARAPALTELFARGGHDGPQTYETGDPGLSLERATSLEASMRINSGPFRFEGSVYGSWFHNFIYGDLTGRMCDDDGVCSLGGDGDLRELIYRQQGAYFRGLEGQAHYEFYRNGESRLTARVLGDYTRATFSDGSNVPRIPAYRLGGGLDWESRAVDAGVTYIRAFRQTDYGAFDTATDGYDSLDAQIAWRPFSDRQGVEFSIVGQNLTNSVQRNAASLNKELVVAPGRNVRFVIKAALP